MVTCLVTLITNTALISSSPIQHMANAYVGMNNVHLTYVTCLQKNLLNFATNECLGSSPPDAGNQECVRALPPAGGFCATLPPDCRKPASKIPLDPGNGGKSIDISALQIGDIILSTTDHFKSGAIRFATGSPVQSYNTIRWRRSSSRGCRRGSSSSAYRYGSGRCQPRRGSPLSGPHSRTSITN